MDDSVSPPDKGDRIDGGKVDGGKSDFGKSDAGANVPPVGADAGSGAARIEPSLGPLHGEGRAGAAKADAAEAPSGALVPFFSVRTDRVADSAHRARFDRLLGYGAHAALALALIAFAWAIGGYVTRSEAPHVAKVGPEATTAAKEQAEKAELQRTTVAMAADIRALKTSLDALRASAARAPTQEEVRGLEKTIDALKVRLDAAKAETGAALAQLSGKLDRIPAEPTAKLREVVDRLDRVERQLGAPLTTASITPAPAATVNPAQIALPPAKPAAKTAPKTAATPAAAEPEAALRPQLIANWVVRDVYDGIALVEGPHGMLEVVTGETIPGVGAVKSIERRGAGWIVVTSRGMIDSARN
jgi:hypothetical protein